MESPHLPTETYQLDVKDTIKLIYALLGVFCDENTFISLEGDLSYLDTKGITVITQEPDGVLDQKGNPKNGRVVFLFSPKNRIFIEKNILPRVGIHNRIWHILIYKGDELLFASFDNFGDNQTFVSAAIGIERLNILIDSKVLINYKHS